MTLVLRWDFGEFRAVWQRRFKGGLEAACKQTLKLFSHVCNSWVRGCVALALMRLVLRR